MTGLEIIGFLKAFFQFFPEVRKLLNILRQTPQQYHAEILSKIQAEAEVITKTGRPTW